MSPQVAFLASIVAWSLFLVFTIILNKWHMRQVQKNNAEHERRVRAINAEYQRRVEEIEKKYRVR